MAENSQNPEEPSSKKTASKKTTAEKKPADKKKSPQKAAAEKKAPSKEPQKNTPTKTDNPDAQEKAQSEKKTNTPDASPAAENKDTSALGETVSSVKGSVEEGLNSIKEKIDSLSSNEKISDEYEKAKTEAKKISWLSDIKTAFRFFTRLPLPASDTEAPMHGRALWAAPLVGIVVGVIGGLVFVLSIFLGLPEFLASCLCIVAMVVATGCFHEDAIADVADGFGGGWTKEQKLEIMKDSRIGTYGATALILTLLIKIGAITSLSAYAATPYALVLLLIASSTASRAAGVAVLALLPPLRDKSSGRETGSPSTLTLVLALLIGSVVTILCLLIGFGFSAMLAGMAGAIIGGGFVGWLANRQIGGQTGDVAGTCQQVSEIGLLLASLIALSI